MGPRPAPALTWLAAPVGGDALPSVGTGPATAP